MVTIDQLTSNLNTYISTQLDIMSKNTPLISFKRPLITRALNKNFSKLTKFLDLLANDEGKIDIESIMSEMMESIMTANPFTFSTSFIGDIEIGGGQIKFNLPLTTKRLVLDMTDIEALKETLTTKEQ